MPAPAHIVRMQDVEANNALCIVHRHAAVGLLRKEAEAALRCERLLLRKGDALHDDLVPYGDHGGHIRRRKGANRHAHAFVSPYRSIR